MKFPRYLAAMAIPAALAVLVAISVSNLDRGSSQEASMRLESALRRAIAAEYAVTGSYPESLDGILSTYGIAPDPERFKVFYVPVAENLPPDLTILDLEAEREDRNA